MSARLMDNQMSRRGIHETADLLAKEAIKDLKLGPRGSANFTDLIDIMQLALELDADFAKQKAYFSFKLLASNVEFNPETMEDAGDLEIDAEGDGGYRKVDLLLVPPLYKQGDSEGGSYDYERLILKGEVVCLPKDVA